ncbi:MAG TPA: hypothetical protein VIU34_16680 [Steroidobacter sp.]
MPAPGKPAWRAARALRMIALGGNIYFLAKIFATDGKSFQYAVALMTGMSEEAYAQMLLSGGRPAG